jgi:hypothetical protein
MGCGDPIASRQRDDLGALGHQEWICAHEKRTGALLGEVREGTLDLAWVGRSQD